LFFDVHNILTSQQGITKHLYLYQGCTAGLLEDLYDAVGTPAQHRVRDIAAYLSSFGNQLSAELGRTVRISLYMAME